MLRGRPKQIESMQVKKKKRKSELCKKVRQMAKREGKKKRAVRIALKTEGEVLRLTSIFNSRGGKAPLFMCLRCIYSDQHVHLLRIELCRATVRSRSRSTAVLQRDNT